MKRLRDLGDVPVSTPLVSDDVMELHASRLLLLFLHCGISGRRIDSLTKMAKLDFFVRYPSFFAIAANAQGKAITPAAAEDSRMVRYRYGPWDQRYYQLLAFLESVGLISVKRKGNSFQIALTDDGVRIAEQLTAAPAFRQLVEQMRQVKSVLGARSGTYLKNLVYDLFHKEVGERALGEIIE